ncbi:MAG: hypothetical protein Q8L95_08235 [Burkholderiales bacterium]|nr:hypothetical protein [Burkholderiales bacterium]
MAAPEKGHLASVDMDFSFGCLQFTVQDRIPERWIRVQGQGQFLPAATGVSLTLVNGHCGVVHILTAIGK